MTLPYNRQASVALVLRSAVLQLTVSVQGYCCVQARGTRECSGSRCTVWTVRPGKLYAAAVVQVSISE